MLNSLMAKQFLLPPQLLDDGGAVRRVGFELEVGNLEVYKLAEGLAAALGGRINPVSSFEVMVESSCLGRLKVERDTHLLTSLGYRSWLSSLGVDFSPGSEGERWERNIDSLSRQLVPCEVVTEPLPVDALEAMRSLMAAIEVMEGKGTQEAVYYAFGLHINASVPSTSAASLLAFIQSFLLLNEWIIHDAGTDFTRRFFTKYIDPFPHSYYDLVLRQDYDPTLPLLLDDYLHYNPTRNRGLDMLPIFLILDPERVRSRVNESERQLLKARPAYHYRLPDCRLGDAGWTLEEEWNRWQLVEVLANDSALRAEMMDAWQSARASFRWSHRGAWIEQTAAFVEQMRRGIRR